MEYKCVCACVLVLLAVVGEAQSQPTVFWNGSEISGPVFLYQDELSTPFLPAQDNGSLVCRSDDQTNLDWHSPSNTPLFFVENFLQLRSGPGVTPMESRLVVNQADLALADDTTKGLWSCGSNGQQSSSIAVGIYARLPGQGTITNFEVDILSSSFLTDPPTFTLFGDTSGGPPTSYTWTRNGQVIDTGVTMQVKEGAVSRFQEAHYWSTLTMTGRLPGVYQYSISNRATPTTMSGSIVITQALAPTDLVAEQISPSLVRVSWTAPSPPPSQGYRITVTSNTTLSTPVFTSAHNSEQLELQPGTYLVQLQALSDHLSSEQVGPVEVTVREDTVEPLPKAPGMSTISPDTTTATQSPQNHGAVVGAVLSVMIVLLVTITLLLVLSVIAYKHRKRKSTIDWLNSHTNKIAEPLQVIIQEGALKKVSKENLQTEACADSATDLGVYTETSTGSDNVSDEQDMEDNMLYVCAKLVDSSQELVLEHGLHAVNQIAEYSEIDFDCHTDQSHDYTEIDYTTPERLSGEMEPEMQENLAYQATDTCTHLTL